MYAEINVKFSPATKLRGKVFSGMEKWERMAGENNPNEHQCVQMHWSHHTNTRANVWRTPIFQLNYTKERANIYFESYNNFECTILCN